MFTSTSFLRHSGLSTGWPQSSKVLARGSAIAKRIQRVSGLQAKNTSGLLGLRVAEPTPRLSLASHSGSCNLLAAALNRGLMSKATSFREMGRRVADPAAPPFRLRYCPSLPSAEAEVGCSSICSCLRMPAHRNPPHPHPPPRPAKRTRPFSWHPCPSQMRMPPSGMSCLHVGGEGTSIGPSGELGAGAQQLRRRRRAGSPFRRAWACPEPSWRHGRGGRWGKNGDGRRSRRRRVAGGAGGWHMSCMGRACCRCRVTVGSFPGDRGRRPYMRQVGVASAYFRLVCCSLRASSFRHLPPFLTHNTTQHSCSSSTHHPQFHFHSPPQQHRKDELPQQDDRQVRRHDE